MFNLQEFQEYVQMNLKSVLPEKYRDVTIDLNQIQKNNGKTLHAMNVYNAESTIAPTIYMEGYFQKYQESARLDNLMVEIARVAVENMNPPIEFGTIAEDFKEFDCVKDKIIMVAVNTERNRSMLANMPHQNREDLSLIYKVIVRSDHDGIATIAIKNEHMNYWGVTEDEIHDVAMQNSKEKLPITIQSMNEIMKEMFSGEGMPADMAEAMFEEMPMNQQMYVISNTSKINGAAAMFYEDALSGLAEQMGTDLFILPSSIHECIAVSTDMETPESLAEMVQEVNGSQVPEDELLSDHVYIYNAKERTISLADTTMAQIEAKVSENAQNYEGAETNVEGNRPRHHR
ncbi:MAG: DUF5688 family protein [bacterium]|nr:DUF5688 family protein [bacterium]